MTVSLYVVRVEVRRPVLTGATKPVRVDTVREIDLTSITVSPRGKTTVCREKITTRSVNAHSYKPINQTVSCKERS